MILLPSEKFDFWQLPYFIYSTIYHLFKFQTQETDLPFTRENSHSSTTFWHVPFETIDAAFHSTFRWRFFAVKKWRQRSVARGLSTSFKTWAWWQNIVKLAKLASRISYCRKAEAKQMNIVAPLLATPEPDCENQFVNLMQIKTRVQRSCITENDVINHREQPAWQNTSKREKRKKKRRDRQAFREIVTILWEFIIQGALNATIVKRFFSEQRNVVEFVDWIEPENEITSSKGFRKLLIAKSDYASSRGKRTHLS